MGRLWVWKNLITCTHLHPTAKRKWNYHGSQYEQTLFLKNWIHSWNPECKAFSIDYINLTHGSEILCREQTTAVQGSGKTSSVPYKHCSKENHKLDLVSKKDEFLFEFVSCFIYLAASQLFAELTRRLVWITEMNGMFTVKHLHLVVKQ